MAYADRGCQLDSERNITRGSQQREGASWEEKEVIEVMRV
jgi:hypothetical protein